MNRVHLLVEGQTEETFTRELLTPHYAPQGLYITPILIQTSPGHKGGIVRYAKLKSQITRLCRQDPGSQVSTFIDLYALPGDYPGKTAPEYSKQSNGRAKADYLEHQLQTDISEPNFIPNIMVHEFETLLFVAPERFADWTDEETVRQLTAIRRRYPNPEDINDHAETAPSKRILNLMGDYQKTFHGPLITAETGLDALRRDCPHFHAWLTRLETLIS